MIELTCQRCGRQWNYTGLKTKRANCPDCGTSVMLVKTPVPVKKFASQTAAIVPVRSRDDVMMDDLLAELGKNTGSGVPEQEVEDDQDGLLDPALKSIAFCKFYDRHSRLCYRCNLCKKLFWRNHEFKQHRHSEHSIGRSARPDFWQAVDFLKEAGLRRSMGPIS